MKLKDNENIFVLGFFLGVIGLLSALVLAGASMLTEKPIADAKANRENQALLQVLPAFDNDINAKVTTVQSPAGWEIQIREARKEGKIAGYAAAAVTPAGYAGNIRLLAGINPDGTIRAILVTEQNETPGLGAEICKREFRKTIFNLTKPVPPGLPPNPYLDQFNGKKVPKNGWKISKDGGNALYVTGATITSRAIAGAASEIALACKEFIREKNTSGGGAK